MLSCFRLVLIDVFGKALCGDSEPRQRYIITIIVFIICVFLALIVPNIGSMITLLGGFSALFIFIFPGSYLWLISVSGFIINHWQIQKGSGDITLSTQIRDTSTLCFAKNEDGPILIAIMYDFKLYMLC